MQFFKNKKNIIMMILILLIVAGGIAGAAILKNMGINDMGGISASGQINTGNGSVVTGDPVGECTISILCDSVLQNMDDLKEGKADFIPVDGIILEETAVDFYENETVYDILKRVCDENEIQMESAYTPAYKSYYVEGIHYLYEFDCGADSGWMYQVNGVFPNYGASGYELTDGDQIIWCYTCGEE